MKLAMLACLAALCLAGPGAHAAPGEPAKAAPPARAVAAEPAAAPAPTNAVQPNAAQPAPAQANPAQASPRAASRAERRRRSYAACNRASHQRNLHGGRRRRFLIRCRLGYERTRGQQNQVQPTQGAPALPGRRP